MSTLLPTAPNVPFLWYQVCAAQHHEKTRTHTSHITHVRQHKDEGGRPHQRDCKEAKQAVVVPKSSLVMLKLTRASCSGPHTTLAVRTCEEIFKNK
jgi:hypothetical protein